MSSPIEKANNIIAKWIRCSEPDELLNLRDLGLTKLPEIPLNCEKLSIACNKLTYLPPSLNLSACTYFDCSFNKLIRLPPLLNLSACTYFDCSDNKLIHLPSSLNLSLCIHFYCYNNKLTSLPPSLNIPSCIEFCCGANKYLYISPQQKKLFKLDGFDIPYTTYVKRIQRAYKRYNIKRAFSNKDYLPEVINIISLY